MLRPILSLILLTPCSIWTVSAAPPIFADEDTPLVEQYIQKYQQYAVAEMARMGIPASIKLAQAIQESRYGQSLAALEANNHFGIKCHKGWTGNTYYQSTGEYTGGEYETQTNVCFRNYATVEESYQDHSNFLASRANYANLFKIAATDYAAWATGLKNAGYATDPDYDKKLVALIRQYDLGRFDKAVNSIFLQPVSPNINTAQYSGGNNQINQQQLSNELNALKQEVQILRTLLADAQRHLSFLDERHTFTQDQISAIKSEQVEIIDEMNNKVVALDEAIIHQSSMVEDMKQRLTRVEMIQQTILQSDPLSPYFNEDGTAKKQLDIFPVRHTNNDFVFYQNGRKAIQLKEGQNLLNVAYNEGISLTDLLKYNELTEDLPVDAYPSNFYVYLEAKANTVEEALEPHKVAANENMYLISQRYGIRLSRLLAQNQMKKDEEPLIGEFIFINGTADIRPRLNNDASALQSVTNFGGGGVGAKNKK